MTADEGVLIRPKQTVHIRYGHLVPSDDGPHLPMNRDIFMSIFSSTERVTMLFLLKSASYGDTEYHFSLQIVLRQAIRQIWLV